MLIGELSRVVQLSPATIRRLDEKGILKIERDRNGWRVFGPEVVATLQRLYRRVPSEGDPVRG